MCSMWQSGYLLVDDLKVLWCFCKALPQNTIITSYFAWPPTPTQHWRHHVSYFPRLVAGTSWWRHTCMFPKWQYFSWVYYRYRIQIRMFSEWSGIYPPRSSLFKNIDTVFLLLLLSDVLFLQCYVLLKSFWQFRVSVITRFLSSSNFLSWFLFMFKIKSCRNTWCGNYVERTF